MEPSEEDEASAVTAAAAAAEVKADIQRRAQQRDLEKQLELQAAQREAVASLATAAAQSQPDTDSSDSSEDAEVEERPPGYFVQAYLRGSAVSKSGLKPEVAPADEPLSDRVVLPPEGSALPEAGVYISNGKRVRYILQWPHRVTEEQRDRLYRALKKYVRRHKSLPDEEQELDAMFELVDVQARSGAADDD